MNTPGPWNIHPHYADPQVQAVDASPPWVFCQTYVAQGTKIIAQVTMQHGVEGGWPHVDSREEMLANARLIAAAPDLLEAIQEYFAVWANEGKKNGWCKRVSAAREKVKAAIAKATGEEAP